MNDLEGFYYLQFALAKADIFRLGDLRGDAQRRRDCPETGEKPLY